MPTEYPRPTSRPLRVYAFDPSAGRTLNNYITLQVPYEELEPGPVGRRLAVIDYDATNEAFYEPVNLDNHSVLISNGLEPSESDPRFHQQMVYAVACETIRRFEYALGRPIHWRGSNSKKNDPFHNRLRLFPHAFQQANAFYDAELRAVLFGYFAASTDDPGEALPGQTVFTCLSHDIVAHEMTHALVDGQRKFLTDATGPDAAAFHEAFADIVALFQHFTYEEALLETINRTGGMIYQKKMTPVALKSGDQPAIVAEMSEDNPMVGLARQFGQATGQRAALRSAIGTPPNSRDLAKVEEPHLRGAILVSAIFDAYFTVYIKRTRDLMRLGRATAQAAGPELHPDLAKRLAHEAAKIAGHFVNICIRALDYCPPLDMSFGDFLRAIVTADSDLMPDDPHGYRAEIITAFRLRGIIPDKVKSYSEEALRWLPPDLGKGKTVPRCEGLEYQIIEQVDKETVEAHTRRDIHNAKLLHSFAEANREALRLGKEPVQVCSYHPIHRISPDGRIVVDFVAELLQERKAPMNADLPDGPKLTFRGGSTVIFNSRGEVRYVVAKCIDNNARLERQLGFVTGTSERCACAPYVEPKPQLQINFAMVHRGGF